MLVARTASATETRALAAALTAAVQPGDVFVLGGDLGAGKTTFTQGFGRALGVTDPITSPTFTLHNRYRGRLEHWSEEQSEPWRAAPRSDQLELNHLDVYRVEALDEVVDLALGELLDSDAVTVIEWGDTIRAALHVEYLEIRLELGEGDDDRVITLRPVGARWTARTAALDALLQPWVEPAAGEPAGEAPC